VSSETHSATFERAVRAHARPEAWNLRDGEGGWRNLALVAGHVGTEAFRALLPPLNRLLPRSPDPDMALNNLERFLSRPPGAAQVSGLVEGRARALEKLLQWLGTSQYFGDVLAAHPEYTGLLAVALRHGPGAAELVDGLRAAVAAATDDAGVLRAFRRFRQEQTLRIGTNDIIRDRPLEEITQDLSRVADAALEVALDTAWRCVARRFGGPHTADGPPARCAVLAFGKLGGEELNYSSDIDLMFVYDDEGETRGGRAAGVGNDEFFARVTGEVVRLLSAHTEDGQAYRVDLRLRPEGHRGPLARSLAGTLSYYDTLGRTWERQALIKVRPVAGDPGLGEAFLRAIEPFVYRKYLSFSEINEIKALKRHIERKVCRAGEAASDVKAGHGGIRDIEFTTQFLQLLNGGDLPQVRQRNTLSALQALEREGCLTDQEYRILSDAYRYLRKTEHRLQLLFDLQTHRLPERDDELRKLALRMGYAERPAEEPVQTSKKAGQRPEILTEPAASAEPIRDPLAAFLHDLRTKTDLNRKILDHLLHETFQGEPDHAEPETDLILDPQPDEEAVRGVLGRYGFRDPHAAYQNLTQLAQESVRFLSGRRCRHFLASIAPRLLRALAETPDPDMALLNLEKVTASLGAKSVLWELFSFNPPSLRLYVDLCASSPFLSEILTTNPGMIDELMDSLVLNQPRPPDELRAELAELCRGAADADPILHSFQSKELLRIGVRDILGKAPIQETTAALSDLAETILVQIVRLQESALAERFGVPLLGEGVPTGGPCRYAILGLGKLGGRELSYQSDLDLILVYEGDGRTGPAPGSAGHGLRQADNFQFFTELAQRVIRVTSCPGPLGRLYQVDMRLRPTGRSGSLVTPLAEFCRYYGGGAGRLWEQQALTRARVVHGDADFARRVTEASGGAAYGVAWRPEMAAEIASMRERLEATVGQRDLKRGYGGIIDVEFLVQLFQLKYGGTRPGLRKTNTWEALAALRDAGLLGPTEFETLRSGYDFLRLVEARLRIVHNRSLDELPPSPEDLERLARRLGLEAAAGTSAGQRFLAELERHTSQTRELFVRLVAREGSPR
jgi:glutamate-ammonia-ligase adenylyltransferase